MQIFCLGYIHTISTHRNLFAQDKYCKELVGETLGARTWKNNGFMRLDDFGNQQQVVAKTWNGEGVIVNLQARTKLKSLATVRLGMYGAICGTDRDGLS